MRFAYPGLTSPIRDEASAIYGGFALYDLDLKNRPKWLSGSFAVPTFEAEKKIRFELLRQAFLDSHGAPADFTSIWSDLKVSLRRELAVGGRLADYSEGDILHFLSSNSLHVHDPFASVSPGSAQITGLSTVLSSSPSFNFTSQANTPLYVSSIFTDSHGDTTAVLEVRTLMVDKRHFCSPESKQQREIPRYQQSTLHRLISSLRNGEEKDLAPYTPRYVDASVYKDLSSPVRNLILDLRNNPGGLTDNIHCLARELLGRQDRPYFELRALKPIFTQSLGFREVEKFSLKQEQDSTMDSERNFNKIVVLINGETASGAEVLAGAIKGDWGFVVGEVSAGKSEAQAILPLDRVQRRLQGEMGITLPYTNAQQRGLSIRLSLYQGYLTTQTGLVWSPSGTGVEPDFIAGKSIDDVPLPQFNQRWQMALSYTMAPSSHSFPPSLKLNPEGKLKGCVANRIDGFKTSNSATTDYQLWLSKQVLECHENPLLSRNEYP
jgi:hypothetical protein